MGFFDLTPEEQQELKSLHHWATETHNEELSSALDQLSNVRAELYTEWLLCLEKAESTIENVGP